MKITDRQYKFARVPEVSVPRSVFDRSRRYMSASDAGWLIPFLVDEAYPGDTFNVNATIFARMATPLHVPMDNLTLDTHYFAVPIRLLWDKWEHMHGHQDDPGDSIDYTVPQIDSDTGGGFGHSSIYDYMGLPPDVNNLSVSALPLRAYQLIWNTWYRDQNLQDSLTFDPGDTDDPKERYTLQRRGKRHDYFTACLPSPQKGDAVTLSFAENPIPVTPTGTDPTWIVGGISGQTLGVNTGGGTFAHWGSGGTTSTAAWDDPELEVDVSTAAAVTINTLRQSALFQQILERDARGGTRYTEMIRAHFGVTSPDQRLQRPEFLGGGTQRVIYNPVPQTSVSTGVDKDDQQGSLAAYGTSFGDQHRFAKSFTEHCIIIGLLSVRADLTYQQGVHRMWRRESRYDFYLPGLAHLGEQPVLNEEIWADGSATDQDVFGYQERWAELRYGQSQLTSLFRSANPGSLDSWHLSQDFTTRPNLDSDFIEEDPPVDRMNAVSTEPHFWFDCGISMRCARPMPVYSVPGITRL